MVFSKEVAILLHNGEHYAFARYVTSILSVTVFKNVTFSFAVVFIDFLDKVG